MSRKRTGILYAVVYLPGLRQAALKTSAPKKLLAINFGGLGDEVLFLPALQTIKSHYPATRITLLTEPRGAGIKQVTDTIDDNITFDIKKRPLRPNDYLELISLLQRGGYDAVLSSGGSPQVAGLLFLSGIGRRIGYDTNALAKLLLTDRVPLNKRQHAALMYHDLTRGLGIDAVCPAPQATTDPAAEQRMREMLGTTSGARRLVMIHPGTSTLAIKKGIFKTWAPEHWADLAVRLINEQNCRVVLAGGPDDEETIAAIMDSLGRRGEASLAPTGSDAGLDESKFFLAYGKTANLRDLVALIALCDVVACVDSAPMHLAVALNKKLVGLFGPTDPAKLLWPAPHFIALRDAEAAKIWADRDPFTQPLEPSLSSSQTGMTPYVQIPPDTVYQTVVDLLNRA